MDNNTQKVFTRGFAASVPGAGHIRYGTPCQDASGVVLSPRPAAIVCDGRGSAKLSHFGARSAVKVFLSQLNVLEPFLVGALDRDAPPEKWDGLCRLFYRTLMQVKLDLAAERGMEEKDFDFTVAFAVAGRKSIGCFQVGDGSIVLRQDGVCQTAFEPDKGEFANQTQFLRPDGEETGKFHAALFPAAGNSGIALTSDGPEYLMFRQPDMAPGPIFAQLFDDLSKGELCEQDLRDYLTRSVWATDPRGSDDRSLAVLMPRAEGAPAIITPPPVTPEPVSKGGKRTPAPPRNKPESLEATAKKEPKQDSRRPQPPPRTPERGNGGCPPRSPWFGIAMAFLITTLGLLLDRSCHHDAHGDKGGPGPESHAGTNDTPAMIETPTPVGSNIVIEATPVVSNAVIGVTSPAKTNDLAEADSSTGTNVVIEAISPAGTNAAACVDLPVSTNAAPIIEARPVATNELTN